MRKNPSTLILVLKIPTVEVYKLDQLKKVVEIQQERKSSKYIFLTIF